MTALDDQGLEALASRIAERAGLDLGVYKDRCLKRRIAVRMRACGVHTLPDYVALIDREPAEFDRLLDALTINVTKFFRNPEAWEWLGKRVLPGLLEARAGRLRIWSAGCASGEEPYTIAMLVTEVLVRMDRLEWQGRVRIDATDVDRRSLERARTARYSPRAFSEASPEVMERYCVPTGPDEVEVRPEIRSQVEIGTFDLSRERPAPARYDLICCRNVIIYFDREVQERLMHQFADALLPDGILFLGKVETILGRARERYELLEPRERVYRKAS
jgi:chemotaxis protein methyltransferase CheR